MHNLWPLIFLPLFIAACGDKDEDTGAKDSGDTAAEDTSAE